MKRLTILLAALSLAACGGSGIHNERENTVKVAAEDPAMKAAYDQAKRTFSTYLARAAAPAPGTDKYMVKVRIQDKYGVEHMWVKDVRRSSGGFVGVIDNEPITIHSVKLGDSYPFTPENVSDWMYMKDGKIHGGYTIRALLPKLPPAKAKAVGEMLAPLD